MLAEQGATAGERAAARAAAARIAVGAGLTLAEAVRTMRPGPDAVAAQPGATAPPREPRRPYAWAQPREPVRPITVEELMRQKAETEAWRKRRTAADDRARKQDAAARDADAAEQRARQAERDRHRQPHAAKP